MTEISGGVVSCSNCDTVQMRQVSGRRRSRTMQDVRFNLTWAARMRAEYGDLPPDVNTKDLEGEET